jgi:hypothetical protein
MSKPNRSQVLAALVFSAVMLVAALPSAASAATFDPTRVIGDPQFRAAYSMKAVDIQAFLETQSGPLKSLVTTDYAGKKKPASQIIYEACQKWNVNPKVMLTMLQKEQSLLTRTTLAPNTLSRAIGAGCPGGPANKYPGFGNQMWNGARLLDGYGEGKNGSTIPLWKAPYTIVTDIYQSPRVDVKTANLSTYKLYIYNPSIGAKSPYGDLSSQSSNLSGNANFWWIFRKYFGDPLANPAGYHTRVKIMKKDTLWNASIGTKRKPAPNKGGVVNTNAKTVTKKGRKYIFIWWGGNKSGGYFRYDHVKWVI